eukprot:CAMPEP_0113485018 /NCGR_PEP_ID=MMETSP0014_2-20120614/24266_1 /TAXON_ID=2857 /ORGANISM="Nitzschia sp." /LENGTH=507 /DNA_ID=CAMNT_0000378649 /DNA_START=102 /DNA_END=1625 /DNA_ORIENTATION=+ /assembly_acc=CAM_ASM_000159
MTGSIKDDRPSSSTTVAITTTAGAATVSAPGSTSSSSSSSQSTNYTKKEKMASSSSSSVSLTVNNLMNQSTIYRRHEARLAKTYALKDDPRPAFLRVMSGLPVLKMVVPPYGSNTAVASSSSPSSLPRAAGGEGEGGGSGVDTKATRIQRRLGDYSEETFYSSSDAPSIPAQNDDDAVRHQSSSSSSSRLSSSTPVQTAVQSMIATGVSSVVGEYALAAVGINAIPQQATSMAVASSSSSPFAAASQSSFTPYLSVSSHDSSLQQNQQYRLNTPRSAAVTTAASASSSFRAVMSVASSTSVLFGTKVFVDRSFSEATNPSSNNSSMFQPTSIVSSAVAGLVVGVFQQLQQLPTTIKSRLSHNALLGMMTYPSSLSLQQEKFGGTVLRPHISLGRHVLASTLYFSIYECLTNLSSLASTSSSIATNLNVTAADTTISNSNSKSTSSILAAGFVSGCAHTAVVSSSSSTGLHFCGGLTMWRTMFRAAPVHAAVFLGYETMKDGIESSSD